MDSNWITKYLQSLLIRSNTSSSPSCDEPASIQHKPHRQHLLHQNQRPPLHMKNYLTIFMICCTNFQCDSGVTILCFLKQPRVPKISGFSSKILFTPDVTYSNHHKYKYIYLLRWRLNICYWNPSNENDFLTGNLLYSCVCAQHAFFLYPNSNRLIHIVSRHVLRRVEEEKASSMRSSCQCIFSFFFIRE